MARQANVAPGALLLFLLALPSTLGAAVGQPARLGARDVSKIRLPTTLTFELPVKLEPTTVATVGSVSTVTETTTLEPGDATTTQNRTPTTAARPAPATTVPSCPGSGSRDDGRNDDDINCGGAREGGRGGATSSPSLITVTLAPVSSSTPAKEKEPQTSTTQKPKVAKSLKLSVSLPEKLDPAIDTGFPDPSIVKGPDGKWWAYATSNGKLKIQMASAPARNGPWTKLKDKDAKPEPAWSRSDNTWAPDVQRIGDGWVMYHSAPQKSNGRQCLGAARSEKLEGPFKPDPQPFLCRDNLGGVIDVSGFRDPADGKQYVIYKGEGRDLDIGGRKYTTPIFVQEVDKADGTTFVGEPSIINWRTEADGYLVEAPHVISRNGKYVHFFSTHTFDSPEYDVEYAVADKLRGPYERKGELIAIPMGGLVGPGGAQSAADENFLVFHGWCRDKTDRCMYTAEYKVEEIF